MAVLVWLAVLMWLAVLVWFAVLLLWFAVLLWLLLLGWERGDCGGLAYSDGSREGSDSSGVTARMVVLVCVPVLLLTVVVKPYSLSRSRSLASAVVWLLLRRPPLCRGSMLC